MSGYVLIGVVLVVFIVRMFISNSTQTKNKLVLEEATDKTETKEQQSEPDNYSESPTPRLDSSHWAMELLTQLENLPDSSDTVLTTELEEVINNVISIPHDYHFYDKSKMQLIIESGYIETYNQITKGQFLYALTKQPHRIAEWLQYSEDQRIKEGWFLREDHGVWQIGAFSTQDGYKETLTPFADLKTACATFIKLEVEYTRKLVEANNQKKKKKK